MIRRSWSGSIWEEKAGYCRALRLNNRVLVAATGPFLPDGQIAHPGDIAGQTRVCFDLIKAALSDLDTDVQDVILTRMYITDMGRVVEVSNVHREFFGANPPVATLVGVSNLVHPDILIEVEAEAACS